MMMIFKCINGMSNLSTFYHITMFPANLLKPTTSFFYINMNIYTESVYIGSSTHGFPRHCLFSAKSGNLSSFSVSAASNGAD